MSNGEGHIDIRWQLGNHSLILDWSECGGPAVKEPQADGFGMSLMQREIGYRLGGQVETNFAPGGLAVSLSFPLS